MKRVLIFSGTTEGRKLAEALAKAGVPAIVCVATEYGTQVMPPLAGITVHQGRMNQREMQELMEKEKLFAVVDATHPFATEVSENIRQSAQLQKIPCLRLQRDTKSGSAAGNARYFSTNEDCKRALLQTKGNILLTTGSKELNRYSDVQELRERLYVRVLPSEEAIAFCREQGLAGRQIIAMQGPFSEEMNTALLKQYHIQHLVTKESGLTGGFREKASAAARLGIGLYVICNPEKQQGLSFSELCAKLEAMAGIQLRKQPVFSVSLIGIGMGNVDTLTAAARDKIMRADYIFGAKRLLACVNGWDIGKPLRQEYPYYLAEDVIPILEEIRAESQKEAVILFSGDSGFYSGCQKLYQGLKSWMEGKEQEILLRIYPGISSVSYFAAACGISWHDAKLISIHGKSGRKEWESEVLSAVWYHKKVILLVSGVKDVRAVGSVLTEHGLSDCKIVTGYQLSYPEEKIVEYTPGQCAQITEEGLYLLGIFHETCRNRELAPQRRDEEFIRGRVPMTKEEIRELAVCKLKLTEHAVVYDIGSGTGSAAVEIAGRSEHIRVYAVEQQEEGIRLIRQNREKFKLPNIEVVQGKAPDCLRDISIPTHAFIGGSGGCLRDILEALYRKNPAMRIVITAVSLETICEVTDILRNLPVTEEELIQVQISRARKAGNYHLMQAGNPVCICSFNFRGTGQ